MRFLAWMGDGQPHTPNLTTSFGDQKFPACDFRPEEGVIAPVPRIMRLFWGREKGTSLISTVREGKEPRGHACKRLMQAANGLIGLSRRFQRFRRRCEDLFPFVFFE